LGVEKHKEIQVKSKKKKKGRNRVGEQPGGQKIRKPFCGSGRHRGKKKGGSREHKGDRERQLTGRKKKRGGNAGVGLDQQGKRKKGLKKSTK